MSQSPVVNAIPPVIIVLCLITVLVELVVSAGSAGLAGGQLAVGWRIGLVQDYAFVPAVLDWMFQRGDYGFDLIKRFVTYAFVHHSFTHALFAAALFLALGKFVGDVFGNMATLVLFMLCTAGGALAYGLLTNAAAPLIGLYPAVFGFIGAYTYVVWLRMGQMGENQLNAFRLIGVLLGIQLVFGLLFGASPTWIAEVAGFVIGFAASVVLVPGGWGALQAKLRNRR